MMQLPKYFGGPACRKAIGIARASTKGATRDPIYVHARKKKNEKKNIGTAGIKGSESPAC